LQQEAELNHAVKQIDELDSVDRRLAEGVSWSPSVENVNAIDDLLQSQEEQPLCFSMRQSPRRTFKTPFLTPTLC